MMGIGMRVSFLLINIRNSCRIRIGQKNKFESNSITNKLSMDTVCCLTSEIVERS